MDKIRRTILTTGAAATAMAAVPRVFAQQTDQAGATMGDFEKGAVRIHFEEAGSGFPLLLIAGGGLNSTISGFTSSISPFNPIEEFKAEYRCIASDLRNANAGQSTGPLEVDRPWDSHTDDQLALMDHLGIDKFMVLGFCIGGPLIWNLLKRAPERIVAAVLAQPSGSRPEMRDLFYENNMKGWGPELTKRRPEITMEAVEKFLTRMYRTDPDFVFTVTRDFVRNCQTPVLILPDDIPAHPYAVAMEAAMLAPKAEVSMFPWKNIEIDLLSHVVTRIAFKIMILAAFILLHVVTRYNPFRCRGNNMEREEDQCLARSNTHYQHARCRPQGQVVIATAAACTFKSRRRKTERASADHGCFAIASMASSATWGWAHSRPLGCRKHESVPVNCG